MDSWQFTPFTAVYLLTLIVNLSSAVVAWRMSSSHGAREYFAFAASIVIWNLGYLGGMFNADLDWKHRALLVEYFGIASTTYWFSAFVFTYTRTFQTLPWLRTALTFPPSLIWLVLLTNDFHHLFYQSTGVRTLEDGFVVFNRSYGPLFYLWVGYSYLMILVCCLMLTAASFQLPARFRPQTAGLCLMMLLVLVFNLSFIAGFNPLVPYDPTLIAFALVSLLIFGLIRAFRFLEIMPVAHSLVFRGISTGAILADGQGRIIDINPAALHLFDVDVKQALAGDIKDISPELEEKCREPGARISRQGKTFEIASSPVDEEVKYAGSRIILLHDVTEQIRLHQEQERLIGELKLALDNVSRLQKLIPICASCKDIRDDAGYWHQIEEYLHTHADTSFSHSICPECERRLYKAQGNQQATADNKEK
ncbi:MAG: PAS domain-containing protein [Pseudomonadales bacterium]|nr:PAS domain-containing protein [Pseudomonadales bacterium]